MARKTKAKLEADYDELVRTTAMLYDALLWCSGSADFGTGGKARRGWLKLCQPLIKNIRFGLEPKDTA